MQKFRKKPVVIEAIRFTDEMKDQVYHTLNERNSAIQPSFDKNGKPVLLIPTLSGEVECSIGDWVLIGVRGEVYPCKNDIFEMTYELDKR